MSRTVRHPVVHKGGGPLMTVLVVLIFLLPLITLGGWLTMTQDGRASWQAAEQQSAVR